ncbi:hypothetical protein [Sphingomonas sp. GM_Shp_1]|uniref:hypothetical protein n=1 Tax=Sphingomonas sp. GM_Shp_1 TaxID=2937381 RepID=UPI00226B9B8B|nr:hypothetical protein [Sphingomonas sp. GM_Shp_1]
MSQDKVRMSRWAAIAVGMIAAPALAQGFTPPVGYGARSNSATQPCVALVADLSAPNLTCIPLAEAAKLFKTDPSYPNADQQHLKVVGAYSLNLRASERLTGAKSPGFLPVQLQLSGGQCFSLSAEYYGKLSEARLTPTVCDGRRYDDDQVVSQPAGKPLRLVGSAWGYGAWVDDKAGTTIVTAPRSQTFKPLFTAHMPVTAIMAMNSPDAPLGNVTLVGQLHGKPVVIVLEVSF